MVLLPLVLFALVFLIGKEIVDRKMQRDGNKYCREHGDLPGVCRNGKWISRY